MISPLLDKTTQKEMMFAGGSFIGSHFYDVMAAMRKPQSLFVALRGGTVKQSASAILGFLKARGLSAADAKAMADTIVTSPVALWDKWQKVGSIWKTPIAMRSLKMPSRPAAAARRRRI